MTHGAMERLARLLAGARRLRDPNDVLGAEARRVLPASTGLSAQGVELALSECLECAPTRAELEALVHAAGVAPRAWVILSANVFVAAHRAIALALASTADVRVRASRREPHMVRLLRAASGELFGDAVELAPERGDHVWAYGADETMQTVGAALPSGVTLHAHGTGIGVAAVAGDADDVVLGESAERLARDVVRFDQRGCLSPRAVLVTERAEGAERFARLLASRLDDWERRVPRGTIDDEEAALATRFRQTLTFAGRVFPGGAGSVGLDTESQHIVIPPPGRNVHVVYVDDVASALAPVAPLVTAIGADHATLAASLSRVVPGARVSRLGAMQTPPFDGPVDRRP